MSSSDPSSGYRGPSREELDTDINRKQAELSQLRREQEKLEAERARLEDVRRRQTEFQKGREEMSHHLTRGLALIEDAEKKARRDVEQFSRAVADLRERQAQVSSLNEETWTQENWNTELTRALTTLENARMEWNAALSKFPFLSGSADAASSASPAQRDEPSLLRPRNFGELCRLGLALNWPVAAVGFLILLILLLRK
jgi:DNA repair exonuclease SbcCD ATPase subunit